MATKLAKALDRMFDRLQWTQKEMFERTGVSSRTLSRWRLEGKPPSAKTIAKLLRVVAPIDREAASWLAEASRVAMPNVASATPATPSSGAGGGAASTDTEAERLRVDSIVCVAADAMNLSPKAVRPALRAAFLRARDLGVSIDAIAAAMAETPELNGLV